MEIKEIEISKLKELKEKIKMLKDERQKGKITYKIWDIVVVTILAVLADCNEWEEIEDYAQEEKEVLKKFLKLTGGIPSAKTYERVISIIDSQELNRIFVEFIKEIQFMDNKYFKDVFSFNGKVDKGNARKKGYIVEEKRYYISSLLLNINIFSYAIRAHWNVENKLHWQMDFTFKSDDNRTMNKKALYNSQIIKKFCLKILNEVKRQQNRSLKRIRKSISRNIERETVKVFAILRNFDILTFSFLVVSMNMDFLKLFSCLYPSSEKLNAIL